MSARKPRAKRRASRPAIEHRLSPLRVALVTGMPAAGKEEVVRAARRLRLRIVRMGDIVREEARRRGLPLTDSAVGGMAHQERVEHGFGIWAERTLPRLRGRRILVDGLRGKAELDVFRREFGDRLVVFAVHASPEARYTRALKRNRSDDVATRAAFRARDERELGWGLGEVLATADVMVLNEGTLAEFRRAVASALGRIYG